MRARGIRFAGALGAVATALAALLVAATASGGPGADALPDIVPDAPNGAYLQTYTEGGSSRLLLRFNGYVHNDGAGPLELRGTGNNGGVMSSVVQRIYAAGGGSHDVASAGSMLYETGDGHGHFHLRSAMQYGLFELTRTTLVAPAMKVGFCLLDTERISGSAPRGYPEGGFCERFNPGAPTVVMGVSPGWRDVYDAGLAFQWVDVSEVVPGRYLLAASADPQGAMTESNEGNNGWTFAGFQSIVPGYVARSSSASAVAGSPTTITLTADSFGQPGTARWKVVSAPGLGTLDRQVGFSFDEPTVVYTPRAGVSGTDSFRIQAADSTSAFPRVPTQATITVTVNGPGPSVSISGAPASLATGTGAQLTATVTGDPPSVTWSVDGVTGGNAASGTVTQSGLYTAPATVPAAGRVTIRAASANAAAQVTIGIEAPSPPAPAPTPVTPPPPPPPPAQIVLPGATPTVVTKAPPVTGSKLNPLTVPALSARGRLLLVALKSARAGTLRFTVLRGSKALGRCMVRTPVGRSVTCSVKLARGLALQGIRVQIGLRVGGKLVASRTARVTGVSALGKNGVRTLFCRLS